MADIRLAKPAAGASESVQCAPDARFVFDFPTTDATLAREGDNLNISFQDGSQLQLQGFYQEYNGENLPSFNIDGTEVAAADFFQAMNEPDLMPAAGPGTGTVANGARFHEWGDSALTGGLLHLDGLDWGFSRSFEWEDHPNAVGYDDDGWRGAVNTVPDLDVPAAPERPYDPRNPGDDPNHPASPQNPGGYIPNTHGASIVVDEGALARGSGQHVLHGVHDFGSFVADVHAERGGSIELSFGGKVVTLAIPQDGSLRIAPAGDASFANVNGVDIRILGAESAGDGKWVVRYEYRLDDRIEHDKQLGQDTVRYDGEGIAITVTDGSGDVARGRLTVEVHDDVPVLNSVSFAQPVVVDERDTDIRVNLDGLLTGADEEGAVLTVDVNGTVFVGHKGAGGEWTFDEGNDPETAGALSFENGEFIYTRPKADLDGDETNTYTFTATITDGDNDSVRRTNSITTIAKPKFNPEPHPTPDPTDPDPTEPGPEDGETVKQISSVVTDDSWVKGGTKASAATPQTQADEVAPAGDAEGGESASAEEPTNIANGSFSLTMNGRPITVTIESRTGDGITLEFDGEGNLIKPEGKDLADFGPAFGANGYGHLVVTGTEPDADTNTLTISYTFTQDMAYQQHENADASDPESKNELEYSADSFTVRLTDDLGQDDTGHIRVSIHDDAPELKNLVITNADKLLDSVSNITGTVTALEGADADGATLVVTVNTGAIFTGKRNVDGAWEFTKSGTVTGEDFSIDAEGVFTYTRPTDDVGGNDEDAANEYTFNFTLTDADKDTVTAERKVTTIAKPKFNTDPHPTPDPTDPDPTDPDPTDPDPTEPDPEDGETVKQISSVVTDDSWVKGGTKASAATPQPQADEVAPAGDAEGGESASAEEPTNIANGSFSLTMNGRPITVTIESTQGKGITLEFDGEGNLINPDNISLAEYGTATGAQGYGHLVVTGTKPDAEAKTLTISYTFTQTQAYKEHGNANDPDELAYSADSFTVKLTDDLGQDDTGSIRVSIHDDAPDVTAPDAMVFTWNEGGATSTLSAGQGSFEYTFGADDEHADGGVSYTLQVVTGTTLKAKTFGGKEYKDVTLTAQNQNEDGKWVDVTEGGGQRVVATFDDNGTPKTAFTLTLDQDGEVTLKVEKDIAIEHPQTQNGDDSNDVTLTGVQRVLTVTDGDGDATSASQDITITIKDTAAGLKNFDNGEPVKAEHNYATALSIDFTETGRDGIDIPKGGSRVVTKGEIKLIGTHVAYDMKDGHVTWLQDQHTSYGARGNMTSEKLTWVEGGGLGVAGATGGDLLGVGNKNVTSSTWQNVYDVAQSKYHSEGILIEPANGTVNYGLTLTLGSFDSGDRAIVAFYLTPQNNNDDNPVKYVEIPGSATCSAPGVFEIEVPDGFTKAIVAPIPRKDELEGDWNGESLSQFSIDKIEFTQPVVTRTGSVELVGNADGAALTDLAWDWSGVKELLESKGVTLEQTLGEGHYTKVTLRYEDNNKTVIAELDGYTGQEHSQNNHKLFTAHLNDNGTWDIQQFYKFTVEGQQLNECKVSFTITDGDGSITEVEHSIDLSLNIPVHRFDKVEMGLFDKADSVASHDNVYDVLQGDGINDLMYGRGGNDILFGDNIGDKAGFNSFATILLGEKEGGWDYTVYDKDSSVPSFNAGANAGTVASVYDALKGLVDSGDQESLDTLDRAVQAAEGSAGGDDALFGGVGDDILFGGAGNDYLVGTGNVKKANSNQNQIDYTDRNMLFGGSGNDILVFNKDDVIEDGGKDIDILLMGKSDWESYTKDNLGVTLRRLLVTKDNNKPFIDGMPLIRNIEMLLVSRNTDTVEQLGITSQESLQDYGIYIDGNTISLDEDMWKYMPDHENAYHSDVEGTDLNMDRYFYYDPEKNIDLQLDVLRDGKVVSLTKIDGKTAFSPERDNDPLFQNTVDEISLMDDGYPAPQASSVPEEGESVTQAAFYPAQEEAPDADTAPEPTTADIVETPDSFLVRVKSLGGTEDEVAFGTDGDDCLNSADDSYVFADAGDDLIVYDPTDYLIDGGTGIDFLLAGNAEQTHSLDDMMKNWDKQGEHDVTMPMVHDVEVMLKGVETTSLQNMKQLAEKYGFEVKHVEGKDILELDRTKWEASPDQPEGSDTTTYVFKGGDGETVMLETSLQPDEAAMQASQHIVLTSNG